MPVFTHVPELPQGEMLVALRLCDNLRHRTTENFQLAELARYNILARLQVDSSCRHDLFSV